MRRAFFALAALTLALAGGGAARAQTNAVSEQDKTFLKGQQETNLAEVSLGKVVIERTTSETVRALATKLVSEHEQVSELNRALSAKLGVDMPEQPSAAQQASAEKIKALTGAAFDVAYVDAQVDGHTKSVSSAQKEISGGSHPEVKAFATEYLPKAQMHLQHSQAARTELASSSGAALPRTGVGGGRLPAIGAALAALGLVVRGTGRVRRA